MNIFLVHIHFLIGHIRPVCSLFENESVLKNLIQIESFVFQVYNEILCQKFQNSFLKLG